MGAHYTSVASFVPTDVDNQIRQKLWDIPLEISAAMAELVLESRLWDFKPVTARGVWNKARTQWMAGHHGEWFSMAVGAYACHLKSNPELAEKIKAAIEAEVEREAAIFLSLEKDGCDLLRAATIIAHNLGDLDRVQDQWNLASDDPLRKVAYKLGHAEGTRKIPALLAAGALNKQFMAVENHRHFALREPRVLRSRVEYLLPIGPFFDDWGKVLAGHSDQMELLEVLRALLAGIERLEKAGGPQARGYPRALAGLDQGYKGGLKRLGDELSVKDRKKLASLENLIRVPQERFEKDLARQALEFFKKC